MPKLITVDTVRHARAHALNSTRSDHRVALKTIASTQRPATPSPHVHVHVHVVPRAASTGALLAATPLPALAEDGGLQGAVASYFNQLASLNTAGIALLASPLLLYFTFRAYQANINPRAKWSDFVFLGAFLLIVANVVSIVAYKTRLF